MAKSNRNRVGDSHDVFVDGMLAYVTQEMKSRHGDAWEDNVREIMRENPLTS